MKVWKEKKYLGKCAECGKEEKETNIHEINIGVSDKEIRFNLCYDCLKELEYKIKELRPEGTSPSRICADNTEKPENAKDCLYCRECIISTVDGVSQCFECL